MEEKSVNKKLMYRNFIYTTLTLNIISIVFGIFYYIFRFYDYVSNVLGFVLFVTFLFNWIITLNHDRIETVPRKTQNGLRIISVVYLVYAILAVLLMLGGNVLVQIEYEPSFRDNIAGLLLNMGGFFGMLVLGTIYSIFATKQVTEETRVTSDPVTERTKMQRVGAIIGQIVCFLLLSLGVYTSITIFTGKIMWLSALSIAEYFISECALYLAIFFITATILALRLIPKRKKVYFYSVLTIGLAISAVHLIPATMTTPEIVIANNRFTTAFGSSWQSIPSADEKYMTRTPYSFSKYLLGMHPNDYVVERDVLYYNGSLSGEPKDENITLYFDVYMPTRNTTLLPGKNSTLIRFHGGSLQWYDKGLPNMQKMNYYFASQGYVVFDVQYGLYSAEPIPTGNALTPSHVMGNFTIDDIMRHVGEFMQYLLNNNSYGANLNSVFISGGSAGGLLTVTTGFTLVHANYTFYGGLESSFAVKGIIPFYPWVQGAVGEIAGSPELLEPFKLVDSTSPPCLIFQGNLDHEVEPEETQLLQDAYDSASRPCATLPFYFAVHVSDMFFEGYYNQIFLYYMERFMYLYQ
ncbi:MAG: hypothetical protein JW776_11260 [Candidatus Lokiarchaeota archaeon]|nr:hypothetical protein [Candidatus Lokiarchaeota archaeon]